MTDRERTHLINSFERSIPHAENGLISVSVDATKEIIALLKEQKQIVRCKNCNNHDRCEMADRFGENPDWFCADGKPKSTI